MKKLLLSILSIIMALSLLACGGKKEKKVANIFAPNTPNVYIGNNYQDAYREFIDAGFSNITTKQIKDIDAASEIADGTVESITVDGSSNYTQKTAFNKKSKVVIKYHTLVDYHVKLHINFPGNLLLNTYDVDVYIDDSLQETLKHGKSDDIEKELSMGEHEISFVKNDKEDDEANKINGKIKIDVKNDLEAEYQIKCESNDIKVSKKYVDYKVELKEGQVKVTKSAEDYDTSGKNYKKVISELRKMGFTNIKENILYDIIFGVTKEGELESVTIDGDDTFTRGDIFSSDAKVIVTYHMKEENDPSKKMEEKTAEEETTEDKEQQETLTVDNCPELADILSNKASNDPSYSSFASKYEGRTIEFAGRIDNCAPHGKYKTRFDYLVSAGDYDPDYQVGPAFKFEDVNYYDLNTDLDTVSVGTNVNIIAEVEYFDSNSELFYLKPISVTGR